MAAVTSLTQYSLKWARTQSLMMCCSGGRATLIVASTFSARALRASMRRL
jgi:hypothetical protein